MLVREDGTNQKRTLAEVHDSSVRALRAVFGEGYDVRNGNVVVDTLRAFGGLGILAQEEEVEQAYLATTLDGARGARLDALGEIIGGGKRHEATPSRGEVEITLTSALNSPNPLFAVGEVYFVDADGNEFDLTGDVVPNGTVTVTADVQSRGTGFDKNIDPNGIVGVRFTDNDAETFWDANVSAFTNPSAFAGGTTRHTDNEYRSQLRAEEASNRSGSTGGIAQAIRDLTGADAARVYENVDPYDGGTEFTVSPASASGSLSQTIDAAGGAGVATKIAVKRTLTLAAHRRFIQHFNALFDNQSGTPTATVTVETDSSGSPSGSLLRPRYTLAGWQPADNVVTAGTFARGDYPAASDASLPITLWHVFSFTSGSTKLKGTTGGSLTNVKVFKDGAWANEGTLTDTATSIIGGVPPGGILPVVIGGEADAIAQAIESWRPGGIPVAGSSSGTAVRDGVNVEVRYEAGTDVQLDLAVTVTVTGLFQGNATTIKDVLIGYVGGTRSDGEVEKGLGIGESFVLEQAKARLFDPREVVGVYNVTSMTVALDGGSLLAQDLTPAVGGRFRLLASNIAVTINQQ